MKVLNLILAVMFMLFAFVQVNDPDPILWIILYGILAVICILAAFRIYSKIFNAILMVGLAAYSASLFDGLKEWMEQADKSVLFDDVAKMDHLYIEESREFLGLMICIAVLIFQFIAAIQAKSRY
jgi:hypothetical protein